MLKYPNSIWFKNGFRISRGENQQKMVLPSKLVLKHDEFSNVDVTVFPFINAENFNFDQVRALSLDGLNHHELKRIVKLFPNLNLI